MKKNQILLVLLTVVFLQPFFAQMTVGYTDFPPFTYQDDNGNATGFFHQPVIQILKEAGFDVNKDFRFVFEPSSRLYKDILSGDVALNVGIPTTPALQGKVFVGQFPVVNIIIKAYWIGGKQPVTTKDEFIGKSIIVIKGYSYAGLITYLMDPAQECVINEANTHESALKMLQSGMGDYLLDYSAPIDVALEKKYVDGLKSATLAIIPTYFIISKAVPEGEALMNQINNAHQASIRKGIIKSAN